MKIKSRLKTVRTLECTKLGDPPTARRRMSRPVRGLITGAALVLSAFASSTHASETSSKIMFDELSWATGVDGAEHAPLWRHKNGSNGFLIRAGAGFTTGFLARRNDYRAFVITGHVSNEFSGQELRPPMEHGAFWIQPAGTEHSLTCVTACLFYVEPEGNWAVANTGTGGSDLEPVLIRFEDMPWTDAPNTGGTVKLAHVWGDPTDAAPSGFFLFFKAGFPGFPHVHTNEYDGVVLQGHPKHWETDETGIKAARAGSHLFQAGGSAHDDSCDPGADCVSYFRFHGKFDIFPSGAD